jgi:hypothetical protein
VAIETEVKVNPTYNDMVINPGKQRRAKAKAKKKQSCQEIESLWFTGENVAKMMLTILPNIILQAIIFSCITNSYTPKCLALLLSASILAPASLGTSKGGGNKGGDNRRERMLKLVHALATIADS